MKDFKKGGFGGGSSRGFGGGGGSRGGSSFGGGSRGGFGGGRSDRGPVTMHRAVCSQCQKSCEVPFRPTGDKPIYCNDCFGGQNRNEGGRSENRFERNDRPSFGDRKPMDRDARPSFSRNDTVSIPPARDKSMDDFKKNFEMLHIKLDTLIGFMEMSQRGEKTQTKNTVEVSKPVSPLKAILEKAPALKKPTAPVAKKEVAKVPAKKVVTKAVAKTAAKKPAAKVAKKK